MTLAPVVNVVDLFCFVNDQEPNTLAYFRARVCVANTLWICHWQRGKIS